MKTKLINGQKLPPQFRTATIQLRASDSPNAAGAQLAEDDRMVLGVSVSSDEPYERYYGMEILTHEAGAIMLDRVTNGAAPLLYNHDRDALIGKVSNPVIKGGKLYVDFKFSKSEAGQQMLADLKDGILTECSIGYEVNKFEVDEDEETYTATRWTLYECSLVSIPADFTVGVGRKAGEETPVEIETKSKKDIDAPLKNENNDSQQRETSQTREKKPTMNEPAAPTAAEIEEKATRAKADGQREERERVNAIQNLQKHFAEKGLAGRKIDTADLAAQFVKEGKTVTEFRDAVMEGTFKDVQPIQTPDSEELESQRQQFQQEQRDVRATGITVVGERTKTFRSLGEAFVNSAEYKRVRTMRAAGHRVMALEFDGLSNFRATFGTATSITGYNGIVQLPSIYEIGVQRPTVADLIGQGTTGLTAVPFMQETSITNAADMVAEAGPKPEATFVLTQTSAPVKKIAVTIPVTDEAFEDVQTLESYINGRLRWMVETTEEAQLVSGDGTGNNLTGILSTSGIQTQAKGSDTAVDAIRKAKNLKVRAIGFAEPTGIVINPTDWDAIQGMKDANNQYYGGGPFTGAYGTQFQNVDRIWGMPAVVTTGITAGTALIGAFRMDAMIFRKKGITIDSTNSHASEFTSNIVRLRAEERLALAVFRPKSFCQITGL